MMIPPPIPFPFPQPPSFAGLTDAEVAAMEGQERVAVEARVNCLRNIAVLLDAATIQLQQYVSIVQALRCVFVICCRLFSVLCEILFRIQFLLGEIVLNGTELSS
ncbi:unnamed protein product [Anisakis simplex]|uniref:E3 ubiquitin-protein ligase hrd-1 (inferred by orthology to a C. elegans protein) n=1 Tax=Anisakis simplex TaxID=6269 RepID=A0A0M3JKW0_ANISI|nr:unnamed protein product [Anisakis simplex]